MPWVKATDFGDETPIMTALRRFLPAVGLTLVLGAPALGAGYIVGGGQVELVVDGDTVQVDVAGDGNANGVHVRNAGIQAMEHGQCGDRQATEAHAGLVGHGSVVLKSTHADSTSMDGTGRVRPLRYIETSGGTDVQLELIRRGLVLAYPFGREWARQDQYHLAAQQAAQRGVGLWSRELCSPGPAQGAQLRMWVNWEADGDDTKNINGEYVRLLNAGTAPVSLSGWWMRSPTPTLYRFPSGTVVQPGGRLTIHSGSGTNTATHLYWGGSSSRFYNPSPAGVHSFGAFLSTRTVTCVRGACTPAPGAARSR